MEGPLVSLLNASHGDHLKYWTIYITVVFAVVGFVLQKDPALKGSQIGIVITAFVLFSLSNSYSMNLNLQHYNALVGALSTSEEMAAIFGGETPAFGQIAPGRVLPFHFLIDGLVVWFLVHTIRRNAQAAPGH